MLMAWSPAPGIPSLSPRIAMAQSLPFRPQLIAHRGLPRLHRENTLPGFLAAQAAGADGWELDVHATADGVVVVHHDATLPPGAGRLAGEAINSLDWSALAAVPVGAAGETIPMLDTVLAGARASTTVYVEAKASGIETTILACCERHPAVPTAIHAFDHRVAKAVGDGGALRPGGILLDSYLIDPVHALRAAGARDYWPHRLMVDAQLVDAIHEAGGRVIVWTVNDVHEARRLASLGVDGICSDVVDLMADAFGTDSANG
jgi:glycerophosphoryl diester phosphodiesterase